MAQIKKPRRTTASGRPVDPLPADLLDGMSKPRLRGADKLSAFEDTLHRYGLGPVAGVDEAGRGACAGPIAIAACILPAGPLPQLAGMTDSKKLTVAARQRLEPVIRDTALSYSVVLISAADIDRYGIQWANITGMRQAVAQLATRPGYVLTDALAIPGLECPHLPVIGGDATARCIAAASILAKNTRDEYMRALDDSYPGYNFSGHKGYGTRAHMDAVRRHGASPIHRYTYDNVATAHAAYLADTGAPAHTTTPTDNERTPGDTP